MAGNPWATGGRVKRHPGERVLARCVQEGDCLLFTGYLTPDGYGRVQTWDGDRSRSRSMTAHRAVWIFLRGDVPADYDIDHTCLVRHCVNVDHMQALPHGEHSWLTKARRRGEVA